jgi:hypothetical protein
LEADLKHSCSCNCAWFNIFFRGSLFFGAFIISIRLFDSITFIYLALPVFGGKHIYNLDGIGELANWPFWQQARLENLLAWKFEWFVRFLSDAATSELESDLVQHR